MTYKNASLEAFFVENDNYDYDIINDVHFVNKGVDHVCNKCEKFFSSRNKFFKHLWGICRKQKFVMVINGVKVILFKVTFEKFATLITNNVYANMIIKSIVKLSHNVKFGYNFRN